MWRMFQAKNDPPALCVNHLYFVAPVPNRKCGTSYQCISVLFCGTRCNKKNVAPAISVDQFYFVAPVHLAQILLLCRHVCLELQLRLQLFILCFSEPPRRPMARGRRDQAEAPTPLTERRVTSLGHASWRRRVSFFSINALCSPLAKIKEKNIY